MLTCSLVLGFLAKVPPPFLPVSEVFRTNDLGFAQIRIPSVVVGRHRTVLAFAEGRDTDQSDQGHNRILLRRSLDAGQTWLPIQVVAAREGDSLNNPCAVVDHSNGRIFLFYQCLPAGLREGSKQIATGYDSPNAVRCYLITSDDDGVHWAAPVDLTRDVKRPVGVDTICSGPGIGIQLIRGKNRGRLVIPFNEGPFYRWNNYAVFSDDHGAHWQMGENVPQVLTKDAKGRERSQVNEVQMAELSDGSILLNSRQFAGAKVRKSSVSRDGGQTWSPVTDVPELRDPSCMGSILRYSFGRGTRNVLLYSGPDSSKRINGTLYASFDDGKTWPVKRVIEPSAFAYSVLTKLPDCTVGCLYEVDDYRRIVFARIPKDWLNKLVDVTGRGGKR